MAKIFFSGIGGSGMSALASFSLDRGDTVAGSDRSFDRDPHNQICSTLREKGAHIVPQDGSGIDRSLDLFVVSTAVEDHLPEVKISRQLGIPIRTRPRFLHELASRFRTLAVAGTSGKSTTAGMSAFLMNALGLDPNFIGGGRVKQFRSSKNLGNSVSGASDILVVEACESDGSLVHYSPDVSVVLNLSLDHHPVETTAEMFRTLGMRTRGPLIVNADDKGMNGIFSRKTTGFSVESDSPYRAEDIVLAPFHSTFRLHGVQFLLHLPGIHNLYNSLACVALLAEMGLPLQDIAGGMPLFTGIERRFDLHLHDGKHLVIDDYAHNPHKISCLMKSVQQICDGACYIFQPHGFAPTLLMKDEYIRVFKQNLRKDDHLLLLPIYYAGGKTRGDISSDDLCRAIRASGSSVELLHERTQILSRLGKWNTYVIFGARDESLAEFARTIAEGLQGNLTHGSPP
jgi:UDP-N-acetylmuramate--alanine ligase